MPTSWSAANHPGVVPCRFAQPPQVVWVTGEYPISWVGKQRHGGIDWVGQAGRREQFARLPPVLRGNRLDRYAAEDPGQLSLPSLAVTPDLRDSHRVGAHRQSNPMCIPNRLMHVAIVPVDRD